MKDKTLAAIIAGSYACGICMGYLPTNNYYSKRESHFQQEIMALESQIFTYKAYLFGVTNRADNASEMHWTTTINHDSGNPKKPAPPKNLGAVEDNSADWTNRLPITIHGGSGIMQE